MQRKKTWVSTTTNITYFATHSAKNIITMLNSSIEKGLSGQQVAERIKTYGSNTLPRTGRAWWHIFLQQFSSSFVHLLIIAAGLSFFLQNHTTGIMIGLLTLASTCMGFYQEYYAEKTVLLLMRYLTTQSHVLRDGKEIIINSDELVPGDIIFLTSGTIIPADIRFIDTEGLLIDESTMSGESVPVTKSSDPNYSNTSYFVQPTIGLCGTKIVSGKAIGIVIATGSATRLTSIATLGTEINRPSMFSQEISQLSRIIAILVVITLIIIYCAHFFRTGKTLSTVDLSLFMIALAVSIVPQAMHAVITFALSQGARAMAKKDVVVKRLASIEDLGSVTILCVDKTGTITENKMTVDDIFSSDPHKAIEYALSTCEKAINNSDSITNAFDGALLAYARSQSFDSLAIPMIVATIPFNAQHRSNGAIISTNESLALVVRGGYEDILQQCTQSNQDTIFDAKAWAENQGDSGKRIVAIASKAIQSYDKNYNYLSESNLSLIGLVSFIDPIKASACEAIKEAQNLGVKIKIITGDAPSVAAYVAKKVDLITSDDQVMTGDDFEKLSPADQIIACADIVVFARTLPEQKFHIINTMKNFERVAFLGEGINDVPSLKSSMVGLVVENAADIAKDAADIVLLKKNLLVIIDGIKQGRKIFTNTLTYFQGMLTSNFSRFYAIALASFFIDYLPMQPLQILLVNFLSDLPLIFIATDNVDLADLEKPRHYHVKELFSFGMILGGLCFCIDLIFFMNFRHSIPSILRTNWFIITVLTELIFFYLIRSKEFAFTAVQPSLVLSILTLLSAGITIALPFTSIGSQLFEFVPPSLEHLIWIVGFLVFFCVMMECSKLAYYRFLYHRCK